MTRSSDYYADLGVSRDATPEDIRRAYHKAARELHPDVSSEVDANELFLQIQAAYDVLSDPVKREKYDQSLSPQEKTGPVVGLNIIYSRQNLLKINEPQLIFVLFELTAPADAKTHPSPPLNVCLVLDRSTSMQGERMDTIKSTAIELIRQLRSDDLVSIVTFSDRADVLISGGKSADKNEIEKKIKMIQTSGGTEIFHGLEAGFFEVRSRYSNNYTNQIILLTDGRTYGDEADCLRVADQAAIYGIEISGLGIGSEWNDAFLDSLAARTGGSSIFLSQPKDIAKFLKEKFAGLGQIYAERVAFDIHTKAGVELRYAFRISPDANPLKATTPIRLGVIPKEPGLAFLLEFLIDPIVSFSGMLPIAEGQISLDIPTRVNPNCILSLQLSRQVEESDEFQPPPTRLMNAISKLTLYRMQERANQFLVDGMPEDASRHLHNLATHLYSEGQQELARATLEEAENIMLQGGLSESGKKLIKYGTRSLLLPSQVPGSSDLPKAERGRR
jgi:Ca-activated chloride channel family protein